MLSTKQSGDVTAICMGRSIGKFVPYKVHAFLIGDTLIDTGTIYAQREFAELLKGCHISTIINTHHHEDHIGNNRFVQDMFASTIYAHPDALGNLRFYQRFVWDCPEPSQGKPIGYSITCSGHTFEVLQTPGHCPDHICLYEPRQKWLFTGDIFCGKTIKYLRADENFHTTLSSLKHLATLDVKTVFCCLKGIVYKGKAALESKINSMEDIKATVIDLYGKGNSPAKIKKMVLGREDAMFYLSNGHFSKQHVIDSILSLN